MTDTKHPIGSMVYNDRGEEARLVGVFVDPDTGAEVFAVDAYCDRESDDTFDTPPAYETWHSYHIIPPTRRLAEEVAKLEAQYADKLRELRELRKEAAALVEQRKSRSAEAERFLAKCQLITDSYARRRPIWVCRDGYRGPVVEEMNLGASSRYEFSLRFRYNAPDGVASYELTIHDRDVNSYCSVHETREDADIAAAAIIAKAEKEILAETPGDYRFPSRHRGMADEQPCRLSRAAQLALLMDARARQAAETKRMGDGFKSASDTLAKIDAQIAAIDHAAAQAQPTNREASRG